MHAAEREALILDLISRTGFVSFPDLNRAVEASPATLRRDLDRLEANGAIRRVRGGAKLVDTGSSSRADGQPHLSGVPFHENIHRMPAQKRAIGKTAAALCRAGESVIIDGGSTTLEMCPPLAGLDLHVLTNSLHIVSALLGQAGTQISVPAGTLFPEQNIILSPFDDDGMSRYRASKLFLSSASIGRHGLMQTDTLLIQAERRLLERADEVIALMDSSKFDAPAGHMLCALKDIDIAITDAAIAPAHVTMMEDSGVQVIVAEL